MILLKRHQRTALKLLLQSAKKQLNDAMLAADYDAALSYQIRIHEFERWLARLDDPFIPSIDNVSNRVPANSNRRLFLH